jgi:hypothetical protein
MKVRDEIRSRACWVALFLVGVGLLGPFGCSEPVVWSTESHSPDGMWIAKAETLETSGFGTGSVETRVAIRPANGSGSPEPVLRFAEGGSDMGLKIQWDGPTHLVVLYRANPELLYYQVLKTSGLDISVQNTSPNPQQEYRPSARP